MGLHALSNVSSPEEDDEWDPLGFLVELQPDTLKWKLMRFQHRALGFPRLAFSEARWAFQRVRRGWDDRSVWNLDRHLCRTLGAQLMELAENTHGIPMSYTDEPGGNGRGWHGWQADLRLAGESLMWWGDCQALLDFKLEEHIYREARKALFWVAEHLGELWD